MTRLDFLQLLGLGAAATCLGCLGACGKDQPAGPTPAVVDFTLDLNAPANAALARAGGYRYEQGVLVARTVAGAYVAVSQYCTHAGTTLVYQSGTDHFYCSNHAAEFLTTGAVARAPRSGAATALKAYAVTLLPGNQLRVQG